MKICGSSASGNCLKVKWTAERLGLPFDWVEIDTAKGETRTPDFLALNPTGQVPAVVFDDGRVLTQSNAIIAYLAEGSNLIPADPFARAQMYEWLFWEQYSHEPAIAVRINRLHYRGMKEEELDPALKAKGEAALARMELRLKDADFLVGARLSLADIALVAYTRHAPKGGLPLAPYPGVRAWIDRVDGALGLEAVA